MVRVGNLFSLGLPAVIVILSGAPARASVMGTVYQNQSDAGALTGNLAADIDPSGGYANFAVNAINFYSSDDASTAGFFANGGVTGFSGFTGATNGFNPNGTVNNTITVLTAVTYLNAGNNSFVVGHDDGVILTIPGINYTLSDGGPTSFTMTPFTVDNTGSAGYYGFTLEYGECCGPPAALLFTINGAPVGVPEPASFALLGVGVLGIASVARAARQSSTRSATA